MAKAPAADSIMAPDKMKPLLALSKREPVHAAFGLSTEGEGVILLDKKAKPKKVASMLRAGAAKAKLQLNAASVRYGRAEVDTEYDAGMVRFFINKDAPGNMRAKLVEVVKRIPYQKVEINVDPSIDLEPEDEEQETEAQDGNADSPAAEIPPAPPLREESPNNAGVLSAELAKLIGRIASAAGNDAGRRAELAKLAGDANGKIKAGDLAAAAETIERLRASLDQSPTQAPASPEQHDGAALRHELAGLISRIGTVADDDPARKAAMAKLANDANGALKINDLGTAASVIAQLRDAVSVAARTGENVAPSNDDLITSLRERLGICTEDLKRVTGQPAGTLARSAQEIGVLLREGKTGQAASMIDVLETQIAEAIRAARQETVTRESGHLVEFSKLLLRWREAQSTFDTNLKALGANLLARPEIQADPRLAAIRQAVEAFPRLVPTFGGKLEDVLNDGISATDPGEKARLAAEGLSAIDAYRQQLVVSSHLVELEQFAAKDLGAGLPLHGALGEALVELKQQLTA